jgi:hypothetical protein
VGAIALAAKVEANPRSFAQQTVDIAVQAAMILDPMKGGVREHNVEAVQEFEGIDVHQEKSQVRPLVGVGRLDHAPRRIDPKDFSSRHKISDSSRQCAVPAAEV